MGELYLVSTPIGNRQDITLRALSVLTNLDYLLCEDTRKTKQLLNFYNLSHLPELISFYEENEQIRQTQVVGWLKEGKKIGLVSNAGTPLISDPGYKLVRECIKEKIPVNNLPGANAILASLVVSGLPPDKFMFLGFLPKKERKKSQLLENVKVILERLPQTVIIYESPYRVVKTLLLIKTIMHKAQIVVCRELTKKFETIYRGEAEKVLKQLGDKKLKGEVVILFH
ncbi:MAG: 16S rRNA (cytidine(1402)-2'-O)-methyltransferase [Candidatus Beckwithbacteria bacterium]